MFELDGFVDFHVVLSFIVRYAHYIIVFMGVCVLFEFAILFQIVKFYSKKQFML